jgi:hypothetical protein
MTRYLVAIHHPDGYDGSLEDEVIHRDISALNEEIVTAGVRVFVGGQTEAALRTYLQSSAADTFDKSATAFESSAVTRP